MLTIRLSRIGKKNKPMYRLIISEKARDPYGRALEILGSYNPYTKDLQAKNDRITYWISKGAGTSATVNNLLIEKGIIKGKKEEAVTLTKKRRTAIEEKKKEEKKEKEAKTEESKKEEEKPVEEKKEEVKEEKAEEKKEEVKKEEEKPAEEK